MGNDSSKVEVGIQQYSTLLARHELFADRSFDFDNPGHTCQVRATITESEHGSYVTRSISVCSNDTDSDSGQHEPSLGSYDNHGYVTPSEVEPTFSETTCMKDSGYAEQASNTASSKVTNGDLSPIMDTSVDSFPSKNTSERMQLSSENYPQTDSHTSTQPVMCAQNKPFGVVTPVLVHKENKDFLPQSTVPEHAVNLTDNENYNNNVLQSIPTKLDQIKINSRRIQLSDSVRPKQTIIIDTDQLEIDTPPLTPVTPDVSIPVTPEICTPELVRRGSVKRSYDDLEVEVQNIYSELDEIANRLNDLGSRDSGDWYYQSESYRKITDVITEPQDDILSSQDITRAFSLLRKYRLTDSPKLNRQIRQGSSPPNIDSDTRCPPSSISAYDIKQSTTDQEMIEFDRYDHTYCRLPRADEDVSANKKKPTTITVEIQSGAQTVHTIPPVVPTVPATSVDAAPNREPVIIVKKKKNRRQQLLAAQNATQMNTVNSVKKLSLPVIENTLVPEPEEAPSTVVIVSPDPALSNSNIEPTAAALNGGSSPELKPEILKAKRPVKRKPNPSVSVPDEAADDQKPPAKSPRKTEVVTVPKHAESFETEEVISVEEKASEEKSNGLDLDLAKEDPKPSVESDAKEQPKPSKESRTQPKPQSPPVVMTSSGRMRKTPSKFLEPPEEVKTPRQKKPSKKTNKKGMNKSKNNKKQSNKAKPANTTKPTQPKKPPTQPATTISPSAPNTHEASNQPQKPSLEPENSTQDEKQSTKLKSQNARTAGKPAKSTKSTKSSAAQKSSTAKSAAKPPAVKNKSKTKKAALKVVVPQPNRGKMKEVSNKKSGKTKVDKAIPAAKIDLTNILTGGRRRR